MQIKKNIKAPRHWLLCGKFTGEFPAQRASNAGNASIWWHHHEWCLYSYCLKVTSKWRLFWPRSTSWTMIWFASLSEFKYEIRRTQTLGLVWVLPKFRSLTFTSRTYPVFQKYDSQWLTIIVDSYNSIHSASTPARGVCNNITLQMKTKMDTGNLFRNPHHKTRFT